MPIIIGENIANVPYFERKIRCPGNFLIPPSVDVYLRKPNPMLSKNAPDYFEYKGVKHKVNKTTIMKDMWGRKIIDWAKIYKLTRQGIVKFPLVTAKWAIEHTWDPFNQVCQQCDKRCKRGQGQVNEIGIKRLNG
jgi:hypothetical protein